MTELYYDFKTYLKKTFGCKVYKVVVDAGFSCPNRDGFLSTGGCIYCNEKGSSLGRANIPIDQQVLDGIKFIKKWYNAKKIMVYFQAFSNTYAPAQELEKIYNQALCHEDIVSIAIGTRPDCIDEEKLKIINKLTEKYEVWIEYGLQSCHDKTLELINRKHTFKQFSQAVELTKKFPKIKICSHIILGLPGETKQDMIETVKKLAELKIDAIKFHALYIEKNTIIADMYKQKNFLLLSMPDYVDILINCLEILPKNIVIQRISGDCKKEDLIAPDWAAKKSDVVNLLKQEMEKRGSFQGIKAEQTE
ncbi:TIGR01212 family radical SAM protein [bacterium]|nr:TIGR01212 family radical SAM protein [bacterium]